MKKKFLAVLVLVAAAWFFAPVASADAYLHVANAQSKGESHVWYTGPPNCNQWDRCYQYPHSGAYRRINDTAVNVRVRGYFRAVWGWYCTRWLYIRGHDSNPYVAGGTDWLCTS